MAHEKEGGSVTEEGHSRLVMKISDKKSDRRLIQISKPLCMRACGVEVKVIGGEIREEKEHFLLKNRGEKITKLKMKNRGGSWAFVSYSLQE
jgi:hypothetical protein